jgi:hypothetical protein
MFETSSNQYELNLNNHFATCGSIFGTVPSPSMDAVNYRSMKVLFFAFGGVWGYQHRFQQSQDAMLKTRKYHVWNPTISTIRISPLGLYEAAEQVISRSFKLIHGNIGCQVPLLERPHQGGTNKNTTSIKTR